MSRDAEWSDPSTAPGQTGELEGASVARQPVPRGALGDRSGAFVGEGVGAVRLVGPVGLGEQGVASAAAVGDAAVEDVSATRATPTSRAAVSTRSAPARAGLTSSASSFGLAGGKWEAGCNT